MSGVSPRQESGNRLDTVRAWGIVPCAIDRGFPAGAPGGRDADSDEATKQRPFVDSTPPEGRFRSGPDKQQGGCEANELVPFVSEGLGSPGGTEYS